MCGLLQENCLRIEMHPITGKDKGPGGSRHGFDRTIADIRNTIINMRIMAISILKAVVKLYASAEFDKTFV